MSGTDVAYGLLGEYDVVSGSCVGVPRVVVHDARVGFLFLFFSLCLLHSDRVRVVRDAMLADML
eukprot:1034253-Rhodomonas_salina.1